MRFGLNTFLSNSGFTDTDIHLIQEFKSYGAEVIELAVVDTSRVTPSKILPALKDSELSSPIVCGAFGPGRDLRGSEEARSNTVKYLHELIELADQLESNVICGPFYSETGRANYHTTEEREQQIDRIVSALRPICKRAEATGIILAVEPLNRFETDCINTIDQAIDLINRVDSPALKIHVDTFHMNIEEDDSASAIIKADGHIGHVHASASHRGLLGNDQVDWNSIFSALREINYDGDIVIESFASGNETIAKAASIWRPLYDSPKHFATEGLAFLKDKAYML
ncbi:sugar phosphate isomerase/epimerase family protein [Rubellicoccus peritrichatus]|uniref:Sugar phosphate isomerase/epimerase family protein n=1 Tax=Rubellicoccus peritrichatus TaxID=3080537 RepID=A0AAQ3LBU9_9BACT|nr:sugar phosphate isomerase/epimerase family protein [Puniceicoccus sp. CR14]WOO39259.1 sugar phosphate isomerase/epimerase family protein [Puniceicoccus sp. CR14]